VIDHNKPTLGKQEQLAVSKVLESGYISKGLKVNNPVEIKDKLLAQDTKAIIPIKDWGLLDSGTKYKNAYNLTQATLSLPIYPSLKNKDVEYIIEQLHKVIK